MITNIVGILVQSRTISIQSTTWTVPFSQSAVLGSSRLGWLRCTTKELIQIVGTFYGRSPESVGQLCRNIEISESRSRSLHETIAEDRRTLSK